MTKLAVLLRYETCSGYGLRFRCSHRSPPCVSAARATKLSVSRSSSCVWRRSPIISSGPLMATAACAGSTKLCSALPVCWSAGLFTQATSRASRLACRARRLLRGGCGLRCSATTASAGGTSRSQLCVHSRHCLSAAVTRRTRAVWALSWSGACASRAGGACQLHMSSSTCCSARSCSVCARLSKPGCDSWEGKYQVSDTTTVTCVLFISSGWVDAMQCLRACSARRCDILLCLRPKKATYMNSTMILKIMSDGVNTRAIPMIAPAGNLLASMAFVTSPDSKGAVSSCSVTLQSFGFLTSVM